MNKQLHARKRRQFKSLCKQLNHLLQGEQRAASRQKIEAIILKIKHLLRELSGIIARWEMKKMLGAAAVMFGLATASVQGQSFTAPIINPFSLSSDAILIAPVLADLDTDGDLDLLAGVYYYTLSGGMGNLAYYENTGTPSEPSFGAAQISPFGLDIESTDSAVLLGVADLDDDGDLDLLATTYQYGYGGTSEAVIAYYENTGTPSEPTFTEQDTPPGIDALTEKYYVVPVFSDLDDDGDLDLVAGTLGEDYSEPFQYLENIGTASSPSFAAPQANPLGLTFSPNTEVILPLPAIADLDLDGDMDLLTNISGYYYKNNNYYDGGIFYFENTGTATSPQFVVSERNPLDIVIPSSAIYGVMVPALGDLDDDGDIDMIGVQLGGTFYYYENTDDIINTTIPQADFPVNIFPNPASDYLNINTDEPLTQIEIYDLYGRQLVTYNGQQTQIPIKDLSSGVYMLRLINQDGEYLSKRIEKL